MMPSKKISFLLLTVSMAFVMAACSGLPASSSGSGGTGGSGSFTIGGTVTNLVGSGLVLTDNGTDTATVTGTGTVSFTFTNKVSGAYDVEVKTQPSNPTQTCTVASNKGTATANVTTVAVTCTTNPVTATIGGTLTGLATGASVILQNNGGDALTLTANGAFTFKTPVTGPSDAYAVTVNTQPTNPLQICTVSSGSGVATANVTNVAVNCVLAYTIGGNVTGLVGTGLVLLDTVTVAGSTTPIVTEQLTIKPGSGNAAFTFTQDVPTGATYTVSIYSQPSNPGQTCIITPSTASGTATANVTSVVVTCPAVTYSVGGNVAGLAGVPTSNGALTDGSFVLQNVLGNTLIATQNGPFTFATPEALNDQYEVSVFHAPSTQFQGCTLWNYKGVVTANVNSIVVDCGHDDWTWIDGTKTAGTISAPQYGQFPQQPAPTPNPFTNTPGARYGAAGWTDKYGNLWLFGGTGWELSGKTPPDTLNAPMNDMWVCYMLGTDYCEWQLVGAYGANALAVYTNAQQEDQPGAYGTLGTAGGTPPSRLGAATWVDTSGNLWMFGGSNAQPRYMNDVWKFDTSKFDGTLGSVNGGYLMQTGAWTWEAGTNSLDSPGVYTTGTLTPGARTNAVTWTDKSGNFWLFGGYGYDGQSPAVLGFLNDLWEYNTGTNTWTWVSGGSTNKANQLGNYGTQGTPAATNMPGGRQEAVGWYDGVNGNLWLFGGEGMDASGTPNGILNDLWVYNIASKQWTFVFGSTASNQTGVYGLQPASGPPNTTGAAGTFGLLTATTSTFPGSRWGAAGWIDQSGDLWLFGGWGLDASATNGNGALNDMWVYVPNSTSATQQGSWTWIKGSNTGAANGVYGDMVQPYKTYEIWTPGGRSNATYWIQNVTAGSFQFQQFWMFGGEGYDATSTTGNGYLNDMWRYVPFQDY